ncbi:MAG: hypothetical protein MJZ64_01540 [Paludibacteraceae bacterium]|nr:hypothetical protein [Paludibacteraceae bacterium]
MKTIPNILLPLILAIISCPVWSQEKEPELPPEIEPVKEYVVLDTTQAKVYYSALPYEWRNLSLNAAGIYSDTVKLPEITDKDTIYTINLVYRKEYIYRDTTSVNLYPPQLPYEWHNQSLTASGIYVDTVKTSNITIADTIYALNLIVKEYIHIATQTGNTCANELPFRWRKHEYTFSGTYKDTIKVKDFTIPDTVYTLQLKVGSLYEHWEHFEFCPGQSVTFRGKVYTETGTDTIYLPSTSGCDSIIIVQTVAHSSYIFTEEAELCTGSSYIWTGHFGDKVYTQPGVYYDSLTTINGCDSVYELRLFMGEPDLHKDTVIICEEDLPYKFGKHWLTEAGEYFDTIPRGRNLCDSIIQIKLTVLKDKRETKTVTFCQGTGVRHNGGELFYDARTYVDTLRTPGEGCYNIVTTVYTPGPVYKLVETIHCKSADMPYSWHGKSYAKDGVYQDKHLNIEGCDSIWELHLFIDYDTFVDSIICAGDTVFYKGEPIFSNRTIIDSLVSKKGGDSVVYYNFQIAPRYYTIETTSICSNEYIPWPGHENIILHEEGAYFDRYQTALGCDSIFEIDVIVHKVFSKDTFVAISAYHAVDSLPFIWYDGHNKKHELTFDTVIIDTLGHTPLRYPSDYLEGDVWHRALSGGCDSTVSIELMIVRKYSFDTIPLCPNGYVMVDGRRYDKPGDYEHWMLSSPYSLHNDSIHYFHIFEAPTYDSEQYDEDSICSNEVPYLWYSRVCYTTGEYTDTIPSIYGCDSIVHLHLKVKPAYYFEEIHNVCTGDSVWVNGRYIHEAGIYYDSLKTKAGCDSVYQIVLNHVRTYFLPDTAHFKQGSQYVWHKDGQPWVLTKPGMYFDSCKTVADGCDSIHRLLLIEDRSCFFTETQTTCENELPYRWHNAVIYDSGTYYDSLQTKYGMDSVYELNLTVYPNYVEERRVKTCPNEGFEINGQLITTSGTYRDTLLTKHGCDSIIIYHVNLVPGYLMDELLHLGPKPSIEWHGQTLTQPGVYMDSLKTTEGCDSIFRLTLLVDPTYNFYDTVRICRSETPYRWQGNDYYLEGDYEHPYFSKFKMDSVHHLHLVIDPIYETTTKVNRCEGDHYIWRGKTITRSGQYSDTLRTALGCDSISHTIVNFFPTFTENDTIHLVSGTSINWHGQDLSSAGVYYDSLTSATGCDSIYCLHLLVADTFSMHENIICCEEDLPYRWHGQNLTKSGDYADLHKTAYGADSSYYVHFTVAPKYEDTCNATLCHGGQINYFGRIIRKPGTYKDTLLSIYGCDSIQTLIVNWSEEKFSEQTIHLCYGETYMINGRIFSKSGVYDDTLRTAEGCDSIVRYSVQVQQRYYYEETKTINPGQRYIWEGHKNDTVLSQRGVYIDSLKSIEGCDSVFCLTLTVNPTHITFKTADVCSNDMPYLWRGTYYYEAGIYDDTLQTKQQCDSIFRLTLNVHTDSIADQYYDLCLGQSIGLGGKTYTNSAIYYDTVYTKYGCTQVTRHIIRFHPEYRVSKTVVLGEGEEYDFYGRILTKPGTYTKTFPTAFGCDSTIVLTITFCIPKSETIVNLNICEGDTIRIGDTTVTKAGQYYRTYPSKYGCDSTVRYIVKSNPTYHWTTRATFCLNEPYRWLGHLNDTVITKPGQYMERLKTIAGCDSIYSLILTAAPSYLSDTTIYVCKDEIPYKHKGLEYYTDMDFADSMRTQGGCDSISITRYRLNNHCSDMDLYTRCEGDELIVDNRWIIEDGEYRIQINRDSLHRFVVLSHPAYEYSVNVPPACDSLFYEGDMYYARGYGKETFTVDRHLHSIYNCDSIEHVTMTIYRSAPTLVHSQTIYNYASVLFGGELYNTPGTYTHRYHTSHGCDSTCILNLDVIYQDSTDALHYHYCQASKDNIEIFGKLYHPAKDTIIFDTTAIPNVGMFIIKKAIVRVSYPFTVTSVQTESEVCSAPYISFDIVLGLDGSYPEKYELDFLPSQLSASPTHQEGRLNDQSTINVLMDGRGLCVNPGSYPYQLKLTAQDCHMSDTIIQSSIIVRYPDNIMEANWNNVVALVNEEHNEGRWKFLPPYEWQVLTESGQDKTALINPNVGLPYLYSDYLESGDRVVVSLHREGYDKVVPSCEFTFYPVPTEARAPISVYPTAARKTAPITIESSVCGQYILYNNAGQPVCGGAFNDGKQTFTIPSEAGCYLLQLQPNNEAVQIKKIIVY